MSLAEPKARVETAGGAVPPLRSPLARRLRRDRYSRFVGIAKVVLPAIAVGLVLLVIVWSRFDPREQGLTTGLTEVSLEDANSSTMLRPRFAGVDERGQPFAVTAERALQTSPEAELIELEAPKGDLSTAGNGWVSLSAQRGTYDRAERTLDLEGEVALFHDSGLEVRSATARIDLAAGRASGDSPVEALSSSGRIDSAGFRVEERGNTIVFTGPARLLLLPSAEGLR